MPVLLKNLFGFIPRGMLRYGANSVWLLAEKAVRLLVGFTVGVYVARSLGAADYGKLNFAVSIAAMAGVFADAGLDSVLIRDLAARPDDTSVLLKTGFLIKCGGFLVTAALTFFLIFTVSGAAGCAVLISAVLAGYAFRPLTVFELYFRARVMGKYSALSQIAAVLAVSLLRIVLVLAGADLLFFAFSEALIQALCGLMYWFFFLRTARAVTGGKTGGGAAEMLRMVSDALPFLLSACAVTVYMRIDQVMVGSMLGEAEVGCYAVAVRWVELLYFIPSVIGMSFLPALVNTAENRSVYAARLDKLFALMFYAALVCVAALFFCAPLISGLYGPQFAGSITVMRIYALVLLFIFTGAPMSSWIVVENLQRYYLLLTVLNALFNIAFNWIFIRRFGVTGAAWATLATYCAGYAVMLALPALRPMAIRRITAPFRRDSFRLDNISAG